MENKSSSGIKVLSQQLDFTNWEQLETKDYDPLTIYKHFNLKSSRFLDDPKYLGCENHSTKDLLQSLCLCANSYFSDICISILYKGEEYASTVSYSSSSKSIKVLRSSPDFFFKSLQTIKKSNNSMFLQNQKSHPVIPFNGYYHSKTLSTSQQSIIISFSNNEFIEPPSEVLRHLERELEKHNDEILLIVSNQRNKVIQNVIDSFSNDFEIASIDRNESHLSRVSLLGELLNTLKHDLSNPLFGIKLSSSILCEKSPQSQKEFFTEIHNGADRCLGLINEFETIYNSNFEKKSVTLKPFLQSIISSTKSQSTNVFKSLEFSSQNDESLSLKTIPTFLAQVLFNLIINSCQAMKDSTAKKINICIQKKFNVLVFSISDTGPGIDPDLWEKIFEPFYTTKKEGHGLGLSICRELVKKLDGKIFLTAPSQGNTTFNLLIKHE